METAILQNLKLAKHRQLRPRENIFPKPCLLMDCFKFTALFSPRFFDFFLVRWKEVHHMWTNNEGTILKRKRNSLSRLYTYATLNTLKTTSVDTDQGREPGLSVTLVN